MPLCCPDNSETLSGCCRNQCPDAAEICIREGLFRAIITMLATNQEFRAIHRRNLTRENNPLTKMESVIALCGKLIRVIFAILTKGNDYDAKKMMDDMNRSMKAA